MRTQLLFALALLCSGAIARAQPAPGPAVPPGPPTTASGETVIETHGAPGAVPGHATGEPPPGHGYYPQLSQYYANLAAAAANFPSQVSPAAAGYYKPSQYWVNGGYTLGWITKDKLPGPVVTTGEQDMTQPLGKTGAIDQPSTRSLFGPDVKYDAFSGAFVEVGYYCDCDRMWSVEGRGFALFQSNVKADAASGPNGSPIIARPFFDATPSSLSMVDATTGQETAFVDSLPGQFSGSVSVRQEAEMWGLEVNARQHSSYAYQMRADWLFGFRYLHFRERLSITDTLKPLSTAMSPFTFVGTPVSFPNQLQDQDVFRGTNDFYGGQIGVQLNWTERWYFLNLFGKLGLGVTQQQSEIAGTTTLIVPGGKNQAVAGGILAQPSNIGTRDRTRFSIVPELGVNVGAFVTEHVRVSVGYSLLMWNAVTRPGDLIDRAVSTTQIPSSPTFGMGVSNGRPEVKFTDSFLTTQFLNFGLEFLF